VPSRALYWVGLAVWVLSAVVVIAHPRGEDLLARKVYRLRPPSALESQRLGPAWWAVCTAAGVDPNRYRLWIHEGPGATAPATAGAVVAVTSWAMYVLPPRHLEAVLAHELAHHLAIPRLPSLLLFWLTLPRSFDGQGDPLRPPASRAVDPGQGHDRVPADRRPWAAVDLGYGALLAEVFTGREYERPQSWATAPRQGLKATQPLDTARLRALERHLAAAPRNRRQPG
jgi:hypothetical protein